MPFYGGVQSFLEAAPLKNIDLKVGIACYHKLPKILLLNELQICLLLLSYFIMCGCFAVTVLDSRLYAHLLPVIHS